MLTDEEKKVINSLENEYKKLEEKGNILFPLYKQQTKILLNHITKLQKENKEKDKQIDLMAEFIAGLDIENDFCEKIERLNECDKMAFGECEGCIKQYFKTKAKNGD